MRAVVWHGVGDIRVDQDPGKVLRELTGGTGPDRVAGWVKGALDPRA
jgi:hypothetical protein